MSKQQNRKKRYSELDSFALDPEGLNRRIEASYPDFYLMIIGLVQSIATVFWATKFFETPIFIAIEEGNPISMPTQDDWGLYIRFALILTLIVIVTFEYVYAIVMYRRNPRYEDIYIPLLLGISEFVSIQLVSQPSAWWAANATASLLGIAAWWSTFNLSPLNFRHGTKAGKIARRQLWINMFITSFAVLFCANAFRLHNSGQINFHTEFAHYVLYFSVGAILIYRGSGFLDALREKLELDRASNM